VSSLRLLCLHGPNLNLLGTREPQVYGSTSLDDVRSAMAARAKTLGVELEDFQSNSEGALIDRIHAAAADGVEGILINPGGLGHTSVSLRDALLGVGISFVELHCSNIAAREEFRHVSLLSDIALGVISGFGPRSYDLALDAVVDHLQRRR
jgi:3-dehydroquinate dehydratase-2